jgi:hypothetical protein
LFLISGGIRKSGEAVELRFALRQLVLDSSQVSGIWEILTFLPSVMVCSPDLEVRFYNV